GQHIFGTNFDGSPSTIYIIWLIMGLKKLKEAPTNEKSLSATQKPETKTKFSFDSSYTLQVLDTWCI
ncbi:unnamed protein product, partial [Prunus brigantina]